MELSTTIAGMIQLYVLFSLATAITGLTQIFSPVFRRIKNQHADNLMVMSPVKSNLLFMVFGFITSPLLFEVLMIPQVANRFNNALYDSLVS